MTEKDNELDTAELLHFLEQEVIGLTRYWKTFLDLYGESEERVGFLASVGPDFFETIHFALRDAIVMGIGRLVDRPGSGDRKNASFPRLMKGLDKTIEESTIEKAEGLLKKIESLAKPINETRNKHIGHSDVDTIQGTYEVSPVLIDNAEECLRLMQNLLNTLSGALIGHTTVYDAVQPGSVEIVLGYLKRGVEVKQR
jgi:hypothetical protein